MDWKSISQSHFSNFRFTTDYDGDFFYNDVYFGRSVEIIEKLSRRDKSQLKPAEEYLLAR